MSILPPSGRPLPALVALATLALVCLGVSACCSMEENAAATSACTGMANNTACKACCGSHGSRKTSYLSNKCTCYK